MYTSVCGCLCVCVCLYIYNMYIYAFHGSRINAQKHTCSHVYDHNVHILFKNMYNIYNKNTHITHLFTHMFCQY